MDDVERVKDLLETYIYKRIVEKLEESDRSGIHVTDIVYPCVRRSYYMIREREVDGHRFKGSKRQALILFIGKQIHEHPLSRQHEVEVEYEGLVGHIDEVIETRDMVIILDKKTTREDLDGLVEPHPTYVTQVNYYAYILLKMRPELAGKTLYGAIWYLDFLRANDKLFIWRIYDQELKDIETELNAKLAVLKEALRLGFTPPPKKGEHCRYCPYLDRCFREYGAKLERDIESLEEDHTPQ